MTQREFIGAIMVPLSAILYMIWAKTISESFGVDYGSLL